MENLILISDANDVRIDSWLSEKLEKYSRTYIQKLIDNGDIHVNGKKVKTNYKLRQEDRIEINIPETRVLQIEPEKIELDILYEDEHIIVINKGKGMVVHPAPGNYSGTLVNAIMEHCGSNLSDINGVIRPGIVHRIDKDTTGALVVAKSNVAHEKLSQLLKRHDIKRVYAAICDGVIPENSGRIEAPIGRHPVDRKKMAVNTRNGRPAVTHFKVLERFKDATYAEFSLETGRTHQIRVHMSYIGYPILGDEVYGKRSQKYVTEGQALHARILGFEHPVTGRYMEFEAPLPGYFNEILEKMREDI